MSGDWPRAHQALEQLEAHIGAALAVGDVAAAVRLAFHGAAEAAARISEAPTPVGARVLGVFVEVAPQSLTVDHDGTLREDGTCVSLACRRRDLDPREAARLVEAWVDVGADRRCWTADSAWWGGCETER